MAKSKYDDEPVEYCLACNSLHLVHEESRNVTICMNCGAEDFTAMSKTIDEYLKYVKGEDTENVPY